MDEEFNVVDIQKIEHKVSDIKKRLQKHDDTIDEVRKKIEELNHKERELRDKKILDVNQSFEDLEQEFQFVAKIKERMTVFLDTVTSVKNTQEELINLYKRSFNKLSSKRVVIPRTDFDFYPGDTYYGSKYNLTLYSKGFGKCRDGGLSKAIDDWDDIKRIFSCPELIDYIDKQDKRDVFCAFVDAFSNWIEVPEDPHITVKKPIPFIRVENSYQNVEIKTETINTIQISYEAYYGFQVQFDHHRERLDRMKFSHLYALAMAWTDLSDAIDAITSKLESIVENNKNVIQMLKDEIAHIIVVDEL